MMFPKIFKTTMGMILTFFLLDTSGRFVMFASNMIRTTRSENFRESKTCHCSFTQYCKPCLLWMLDKSQNYAENSNSWSINSRDCWNISGPHVVWRCALKFNRTKGHRFFSLFLFGDEKNKRSRHLKRPQVHFAMFPIRNWFAQRDFYQTDLIIENTAITHFLLTRKFAVQETPSFDPVKSNVTWYSIVRHRNFVIDSR